MRKLLLCVALLLINRSSALYGMEDQATTFDFLPEQTEREARDSVDFDLEAAERDTRRIWAHDSNCFMMGRQLHSLSWSADGKYLASIGVPSTLEVRTAEGEHCFRRDNVDCAAWSPKKNRLAICGRELEICTAKGELKKRLERRWDFEKGQGLQWSPDGKYLANIDSSLSIWKRNGELMGVWQPRSGLMGQGGPIWSSDGEFVATRYDMHNILIHTRKNSALVKTIDSRGRMVDIGKDFLPVPSCKMLPIYRILSEGNRIEVCTWKGDSIYSLDVDEGGSAVISTDSKYCFLTSRSSIEVRKLCDGRVVWSSDKDRLGLTTCPKGGSWSPDRLLVIYNRSGEMKIIDLEGKLVGEWQEEDLCSPERPAIPCLVSWSPDGTRLAYSIAGQNQVRVRDVWRYLLIEKAKGVEWNEKQYLFWRSLLKNRFPQYINRAGCEILRSMPGVEELMRVVTIGSERGSKQTWRLTFEG